MFFKGEMFNTFVKVIPNFYICKATVEFTIVRFDGINKIGCFRSKPGIVRVHGCYCLKKVEEDYCNSDTREVHCDG